MSFIILYKLKKLSKKSSFLNWYSGFVAQFNVSKNEELKDKPFSSNSLYETNKNQTKQNLNSKNEQDSLNPLNGTSGGSSGQDRSKQQVLSITYEEIGLFPRSFNRVFDRFFKQLFFDVENLVIQEYRFYRYLFLTTVKCVFVLISVPLFVNFCTKTYLIRPVTEYYWNSQQPEIFLNSYMQKKAFTELKDFEERIYFESLLLPSFHSNVSLSLEDSFEHSSQKIKKEDKNKTLALENRKEELGEVKNFQKQLNLYIQKGLQAKTFELAEHYNEESVESITNFFADLVSFGTLWFLISSLEIQINITKSFLLEVFFGLDDSKKSLLMIFVTDLLVGYHSPNIWELIFSTFFDHYGLPENETTIFLLVATLPVLLDVLFKYLIFRHLNRASPATVATYHAMIE